MLEKCINGENEIEVYLVERFESVAPTSIDSESLKNKRSNLEKTHRSPDPMGVHIDMQTIKFNTLWRELIENHGKVNAYDGMERMMKLDGILELPCYSSTKNQIEWVTPKAIFRRFVTRKMLSLMIEGAQNIIVDFNCEFITKSGKKNFSTVTADKLVNGYGFRNPREPIAEDMKLVEKSEMNYSGYVYAIDMPKIHNFVCQGLLMSDINKILK